MLPQATQSAKSAGSKKDFIVIYVLAAIILLGGLAIIIGSFFNGKPLQSADGLTAQELDTRENYYFEEILVIDSYAVIENDENDIYLYVAFFDKEDKVYIASLSPKKDSDLMARLWDYFEDENAYIGDLTISAAVDVSKISAKKDDVEAFYRGTLEDMVELFRSSGFEAEGTLLHFDYLGADEAGYEKHQSRVDLLMRIFGGVFCAIGLLLFVFGPRMMKKRQQQMAAAQFAGSTPVSSSVVDIHTTMTDEPVAETEEK